MSDVAISYSSIDGEEALRLAAALRDHGISVWMDDATEVEEGIAGIGVPAGQDHWDVISRAIDDASVLLVLDTEHWRASHYCRREYDHADREGKAIAVDRRAESSADGSDPIATVEFTGVAEFAERVRALDELAEAHARLLVAARAGAAQAGRWRSLLLGHPAAADATAVTRADLAAAGLRATPAITAYIAEVFAFTRRRRRIGLAAGTALAALVTVLACVAVFGWTAAVRDRAAADAAAGVQASLLSAEQALDAPTTGQALAHIDVGLAAADTPQIRAAAHFVKAATQERLTAAVPVSEEYRGLAVASDGSVAVVTASDLFVVVDVATGAPSHTFTLPVPIIGPSVALLPDNSAAIVLTRTTAGLAEVALDDGTFTTRGLGDIRSFTVDTTGALWWADADGAVFRSVSAGGAIDAVLSADASRVFTVIQVSADGLTLRGLTTGGTLVTFVSSDGDRFRQEGAIELHGEWYGQPVADGDDPYVEPTPRDLTADRPFTDRLVQCENTIVVSRDHTYWTIRGDDVEADDGLYNRGRSLACFGDAGINALSVFSNVQTHPKDSVQPANIFAQNEAPGVILMASSLDHSTLGVLHSNGSLVVINTARVATAQPDDSLREVVTWGDDLLTVSDAGEVRTGAGQVLAVVSEMTGRPVVSGDDFAALADWNEVQLVLPAGETGRIHRDSYPLRRLELTASGQLFGNSALSFFVTTPLAGDQTVPDVAVTGLRDGEALGGASLSADGRRVGATTTLGRVILIDAVTGAIVDETAVTTTAQYVASRFVQTPEGERLLVPAGDGYLRLFDDTLAVTRVVWLGDGSAAISVSRDTSRAVMTLLHGDLVVIDTATLETLQVLADNRSTPTYVMSLDGEMVVGVNTILYAGGGASTELDTFPVWPR